MINLNHYLQLKRKSYLNKCKNIRNEFSNNYKITDTSNDSLYQTINELINKLENKYE